MADITSSITVYEQDTGMSKVADIPFAYKEILVEVPDTADAADTLDVTLANYGITNAKSVKGFKHTTNNSVVALEAPTTSVTAGVMTITIPAGTDDDIRVYLIGGY